MARNIETVGSPRVRSRCRSCLAPIFWAETPLGRSIPIDWVQVPGGNVTLVDGVAVVNPGFPMPEALGFVPHFATCPNADEHRRGR